MTQHNNKNKQTKIVNERLGRGESRSASQRGKTAGRRISAQFNINFGMTDFQLRYNT